MTDPSERHLWSMSFSTKHKARPHSTFGGAGTLRALNAMLKFFPAPRQAPWEGNRGADATQQNSRENVRESYLTGVSRSSMRPLMKEATAWEASLTASASLAMVSFCMSSSRTLRLWAFSLADMMTDLVVESTEKVVV